MNDLNIREVLAESGKLTVSQMMNYLKSRYNGKYDIKTARNEAKDLVREMKEYI